MSATTSASRLLLVEDNAELAGVLAAQLALHGQRVDVARDAGAALSSFHCRLHEIVVIDLGLPEPDGLVLAEELLRRSRASSPTPYFVAITAHGEASLRERALEAGFHDFREKPLDEDDLREISRRIPCVG